jgi:hypothetical protein
MGRKVRDALRIASEGVDTTRPILVIAAVRVAAEKGDINYGQAKSAERLICRYHATNDNWFNEMLEIMDDRVKVRPTLW